MHGRISRALVAGVAASLALSTAGCARSMSDLEAYIAEVKARPGGRIEPLPQIRTYESFTYEPGEARSPFRPERPLGPATAGGGGVRPDANRSREYLESFPLDSLDMVGTLQLGGALYGLVQTSDGLIHRVTVGNYVGQNDGRVVGIEESEIQLTEIIPDGLGGYMEQPAMIGLGEN